MIPPGGVLLDRYPVDRPPGADVFLAGEFRLDRNVAIKAFRIGAADSARFDAETRLLARLTHRNLANARRARRRHCRDRAKPPRSSGWLGSRQRGLEVVYEVAGRSVCSGSWALFPLTIAPRQTIVTLALHQVRCPQPNKLVTDFDPWEFLLVGGLGRRRLPLGLTRGATPRKTPLSGISFGPWQARLFGSAQDNGVAQVTGRCAPMTWWRSIGRARRSRP